MKTLLTFFFAGLLFAACGSTSSNRGAQTAQNQVDRTKAPVQYGVVVKAVYPHSRNAYTQGLEFSDGVLWEGTGQNGESRLQRIDLQTGKETIVSELPASEFGEGITLMDGRIYQLTWTDNKAYVYDQNTGRVLRTHRYSGEGWGLANDGETIYKSTGSAKIYRLDPETFRQTGSVTVTLEGEVVPFINELEWIDGRIWANVYMTDQILIIDPQTGIAEGVVDCTGLLPAEDYEEGTDVLNGIACDAQTGKIYLTGKNWPKIFEVELVRK